MYVLMSINTSLNAWKKSIHFQSSILMFCRIFFEGAQLSSRDSYGYLFIWLELEHFPREDPFLIFFSTEVLLNISSHTANATDPENGATNYISVKGRGQNTRDSTVEIFIPRYFSPPVKQGKKLFTFYHSDTVNLYVSSLQVMFTPENSKYTFLCLFLIGCVNYFCIWHPVFSHPECTFNFILLILHDTYSRNPNTSSIRPSSNPLVALPAI